MIIKAKEKEDLFSSLDRIGLKAAIKENSSIVIKVNIARPPECGHPRTDPFLISQVVEYVYLNHGRCTIAESANGYLKENLYRIGLEKLINKFEVNLIDLDFEETESIEIDDEIHYIPKCLKNFDVRIGIPATSKRPGMIFSNNIKLFVGAVPRNMYQIGNSVSWRPKIHINLHKSVTNIYKAIQEYSPFQFFINGGLAMDEKIGEFEFVDILVGNDGLEMDKYIIDNIFKIEKPEYITNLEKML